MLAPGHPCMPAAAPCVPGALCAPSGVCACGPAYAPVGGACVRRSLFLKTLDNAVKVVALRERRVGSFERNIMNEKNSLKIAMI